MKKFLIIFQLIPHLFIHDIIAQQVQSPLAFSFRNYLEMKKDTRYKLDWISLGPMVNSARADVVQADA